MWGKWKKDKMGREEEFEKREWKIMEGARCKYSNDKIQS